ncbi:esterase-like activity of phytase family protein [Agromyces sp. MMS24-JH15]|uniref:esterase-like activity of phytase family protein n=1 Tax=Agromyces sp. MMS24-JH15 TaxID=3243765 RepID=UPI003748BAA1
MLRPRSLTVGALAGASAIAVAALAVPGAASAHGNAPARLFDRTATFPVYLNVPAGVDPAAATVAEISAISPDGRTVIYTDALGERIGFVDVTDPSKPVGAGTLELSELTDAPAASPTSVAAYGSYVLVVVDTTDYDADTPGSKARSGELVVVDDATHAVVATLDLGGQPDSIAVSKDGRFAAIAIENQRNEGIAADGGQGAAGDLPQAPAGFVQVIALDDTPADWTAEPIALVNPDGSALPAVAAAGLAAPTDPEPEYVSINSRNELAVTLQENNGVVVLDLPTRSIRAVFSAGSVTAPGFDLKKDGVIDASQSLVGVPREPDAVGWVDDDHLATANEGDWKGGTRGWTVFDAATGGVVWDAGDSYEQLAIRYGLHNNDRAAKKGAEPEGLAIAEFDGRTLAFVASERSNFVAVYDVDDPAKPEFVQVLFSTNGPEGILPVPSRNLLVVSSETDAASTRVRSAVNLYQLGRRNAQPAQPSIVSGDQGGRAIGWQALGALSGIPGQPGRLLAASDVAVSPATLYAVDTTASPARITQSIRVTEGGAPAALDVEGVVATSRTGGWLAVEGATGAGNVLKQYALQDGVAVVTKTVQLPADVTSHIANWGLEGVTSITDRAGEHLWVVLQRQLWADPAAAAKVEAGDGAGVTRIGRYDVATGAWTWFGYRLESTSTPGDWIGLSEITAVDADTLAVVERDKLNGPDAAIKRVYTVEIPKRDPAAGTLPVLEKRLAVDVLPALRSVDGWTQEKLEGLAIGADGRVYAVTDNDGLKDATGETVFLDLGKAKQVFDAKPGTGHGRNG